MLVHSPLVVDVMSGSCPKKPQGPMAILRVCFFDALQLQLLYKETKGKVPIRAILFTRHSASAWQVKLQKDVLRQ